MFVVYNGNDNYTLSFGHKTVHLLASDIDEIQHFNFATNKNTDGIVELQEKIEDLESDLAEIRELRKYDIDEIKALIEQIDELKEE